MAAVTVAVLCMERSVQIGGLLGLAALFAVEQKMEPRKRMGLLCILILAVLAFSLVYYLNSQSIAERWSDIDNSQTAGSGRATFWLILIGTWWTGGTLAHLFGFGSLSVFGTTGAEYLAGLTHAHNEWLQMLYECGLVGLVSYAAMIASLCAECIRLLRQRTVGSPAVCFVTVVVLCHSFFDFFLSSPSALWYYVTVGAVLGAAELRRNTTMVSCDAADVGSMKAINQHLQP
jgi:O-antigen ligase